MPKKITWEDAEESVNSLGYGLLDLYVDRGRSRVVIQDEDGYRYDAQIVNLKNGRTPTIANPQNPYSLGNIQLYLENNDKTFYLCDDNVYKDSQKKLKFHCTVCDEYFLMSWDYVLRGIGCSVCSGQKVGERTNLGYLRSDLAEEWSPRNKLRPNEVTLGSNKKVWWICSECGHEWKASVTNRTNVGSGCPECAEKQSESKVANRLKEYCKEFYNAETEYSELTNPETGRYLRYDIYIPDGFYVEVQGRQHFKYVPYWHKTKKRFKEQQRRDAIKKEWAEAHGVFIEIDIRKYDTPEKAIEFLLNELNT